MKLCFTTPIDQYEKLRGVIDAPFRKEDPKVGNDLRVFFVFECFRSMDFFKDYLRTNRHRAVHRDSE